MKKLLSVILCVSLIFSMAVSSVALASDEINVTINGVKQNYDVMPVIVDGRTLVPMRAIFEALGAEVGWIDHSKTVTGTRNNKTVKLNIDENIAYINGQETILDVPASIINSRTMVPVRFISEMLGEKVEWDDATKTVMIDSDYVRSVAIQPGLKPLTNNIHRNIPREFTTSSNYDDIYYYDDSGETFTFPENGTVIADMDDFLSSATKDPAYGIIEKAVVDGEEVAKITVKQDMDNTAKCIFNLAPLTNFKENDTLVLSFDVKLSEPTEKTHYIQVQLQEKTSGLYKKSIWQPLIIDHNWKTYVYSTTALNGYDDFGFRPGLNAGEVLVKNFKIMNYQNQISPEQVPSTKISASDSKKLYDMKLIEIRNIPVDEGYDDKYSSKDAQWRKEAFERIEQHRKGDFKVVVKDKNGNVIPDADVKFSMFESEYKIGTAIDPALIKSEALQINLNKYFNTAVHEHHLKWGPYVEETESF
ncbi:MAG: copper amine oxidase N-terminal domain-containing protein [Ruminococcaceae bacterium]|nr:copper amine oxidase N-terminal domain-containing protein [Oscillospiraceae bacterium]